MHGAAVQLGQPPYQREPDAQAAARAVDGVVRLHEQVEDLRQHVGRDADALVGDAQHRVVAFAADEHADHAFAARELERVGNEIADDLLEPHRVAADPHGLGHEVDAPLVVRVARGDGADRRLDRFREVHRHALQHDLAGDRAADVEQVVHQARHVHHLALDDAGGAQRHGFGLVHQRERMHRALDGAERIAQLVRQHGEEFVLRTVFALRARQRADVAQDQRAMFDVVEHDARQRHLYLGRLPGH